MTEAEKLHKCTGCSDNFYNGNNALGVQKCWGFKTAKLVTRYQIGTWTTPDSPGAFTETRGLSCWHAKGVHFYDKLPNFVKPEHVIRRPKP